MNPFIKKEIRIVSGYRMVHYSTEDASNIINLFKHQLIDGVHIHTDGGFTEKSLDCLYALEGLKAVNIQRLPDLELNVLENIPQLEFLGIDETKNTLHFDRLKNLKLLSISWHKNLFKNAELSNLASLSLWKYKSKANDLTDFPKFNLLQELELVQSTITSLNGISNFQKLNKIGLHYLSKLERLGPLNLPALKTFRSDHCKKKIDHEQLGTCLNLEDLKLHRSGSIKSVQFIKNLRKLKSFRFMDTDILDGDLTPLLGLDDVYFTEKKHFSHKTNAFDQVIDGVKVVKRA